MSQAVQIKDPVAGYLTNYSAFKQRAAGNGSAWLAPIREEAIARFEHLGFPTRKDEAWRHTNLAPLAKVPFRLSGQNGAPAAEASMGKAFRGMGAAFLVFHDGRFDRGTSHANGLPSGVKVGSLASAISDDSSIVRPHLAQLAGGQDHPFVALNTAFIQDGAFIYVPKGVVIEEPIYLLYLPTLESPEPVAIHPRNLVVVEDGAQVTIVETYGGCSNTLMGVPTHEARDSVYFNNVVTEVVVGENAMVDHYKLQTESEEAFHIATLHVKQERSSRFTSHTISLGGRLERNDSIAVLNGEGVETTLNGLFMIGGRQHVDNHTLLDHAKPNCNSHELYKGILADRSSGVFHGKIHVHQDAQKTDAVQSNKNLLLSDDATIDTQPVLEIYADDVRCTHGATVGQLDAEALFYLRSRGVSAEDARGLLIYAFANEIIEQIKIKSMREDLERLAMNRFRVAGGH